MPAESERLRRRIGGRDRRFLGLVAVALLASIVIGFLVIANGSDSGAKARCVQYSHPNFTGGATYTYCGAAARAFCLRSSSRQAALVARCERLGFLRRPGNVSRRRPPAAG